MTTIGIIMQTIFHWIGYFVILGGVWYAIKITMGD